MSWKLLSLCYEWHCMSPSVPQEFICWSPNSQWSIFGDRACEKVIKDTWDHWGWGPNSIGLVFLQEEEEIQSCLFSVWVYRDKITIYKLGKWLSPGTELTGNSILDFLASREFVYYLFFSLYATQDNPLF